MRELRHVYAELAEVSKGLSRGAPANLDLTGLYKPALASTSDLNRLLLDQDRFCLAMIDLDGFKRINDTYGHQTGDVVLKRAARLWRQAAGDHGWVCRYGGEELVVFANPDIRFARCCWSSTGLGWPPTLA